MGLMGIYLSFEGEIIKESVRRAGIKKGAGYLSMPDGEAVFPATTEGLKY
jgi:hypothetical protein